MYPSQPNEMYPPQPNGMYPPQSGAATYQTPIQAMHPYPQSGQYAQQPSMIYPPQQVAAFPIQQPMMYQQQLAPQMYPPPGTYSPQHEGMYHQPPPGINVQGQPGIMYPVPGAATLYGGANNWANKVAPMQPGNIADPNEGIQTGRWSIGLCGCCADCVPNCWMSTCCPCISLSQIYARIGVISYKKALYRTGALAFPLVILRFIANNLGPQEGQTDTRSVIVFFAMMALDFAFVIAVCYARIRVRRRFRIDGNCCDDLCASWCCTCCTIAQMATHSRSYRRGDCSFSGPDVLPPFKA